MSLLCKLLWHKPVFEQEYENPEMNILRGEMYTCARCGARGRRLVCGETVKGSAKIRWS